MDVSEDRPKSGLSRENQGQALVGESEQGRSDGTEFVEMHEIGSRRQSQGANEANVPAATEEKIKQKRVRGLHLPVRAFKSRNERDPEAINEDLKVRFEDVIAEPEGYYTPKFSWNLSQELYGFGKGCCYTITSLFCGIPISFVWGIWFAFLACLNVWCLVPLRRSTSINLSCMKAVWSILVSSVCDPFYQSIGMIFNNMNVRTEKHIV